MAISIRFKASNGHYLCAEAGGGREVIANRVEQGPWETFTAETSDTSNGPLMSGQRVALRTANGQYVCAEGGGGGQLVANRATVGPWETFTIVHADLSMGEIVSGQGVILRTANGQFLCAEGGGGREVLTDRTSIGAWETFMVEVESPPAVEAAQAAPEMVQPTAEMIPPVPPATPGQ